MAKVLPALDRGEFMIESANCYTRSFYIFDNALSAYRAGLWESWDRSTVMHFPTDEDARGEAFRIYFKPDASGRISPERLPGFIRKQEMKESSY